ncbi:hypothetical protein TorRG33x02_037700, partial [Trema orientale]
ELTQGVELSHQVTLWSRVEATRYIKSYHAKLESATEEDPYVACNDTMCRRKLLFEAETCQAEDQKPSTYGRQLDELRR